jgi:hypothetical protein
MVTKSRMNCIQSAHAAHTKRANICKMAPKSYLSLLLFYSKNICLFTMYSIHKLQKTLRLIFRNLPEVIRPQLLSLIEDVFYNDRPRDSVQNARSLFLDILACMRQKNLVNKKLTISEHLSINKSGSLVRSPFSGWARARSRTLITQF